eukprot:TRINITY_DN13397_c0_g1_i1.p1 TRINITY_DN13397_c0_g1~~TRINITY_DN13397_c0_g1_i1.p1  ORF type:complete len:382 (+),score=24.15 TRINITY_DN13397_c0_g1_i1:73-1218(+)
MFRRNLRLLCVPRYSATECVGGVKIDAPGGLDLWLVEGHLCTLALVKGSRNESLMMLDGGFRGDGAVLKKFVKNNKLPKIKEVVCTHAHPDHCMAHTGLANITTYSPKGIEEWYQGSTGKLQKCIDYALGTTAALFRGKPFRNPYGKTGYSPRTKSTEIHHGSTIPGSEWTAVDLPGHTHHMLGLYHKKAKIFYASDLCVVLGKDRIMPPIPVDFAESYVETCSRLEQLEVNGLVLAHGGYVHLHTRDEWVKLLRSLSESVFDKSKKDPLLVGLIRTTLFGWNHRRNFPSAPRCSSGSYKLLSSAGAYSEALSFPSSLSSFVHRSDSFTRVDPSPLPSKLSLPHWASIVLGFVATGLLSIAGLMAVLWWALSLLVAGLKTE